MGERYPFVLLIGMGFSNDGTAGAGAAPASRAAPGALRRQGQRLLSLVRTIGGNADHGKVIQSGVCRQTYSALTTDGGFS